VGWGTIFEISLAPFRGLLVRYALVRGKIPCPKRNQRLTSEK
jgi:hypothetical protein